MMEINDILSLILSIIAAIVSIGTFYVTFKWRRKKLTTEAYLDLQAYLFYLYEYDKDEIETFLDQTSDKEYKVISSVLGRIEVFATATMNRTYDKKLVYELVHGYLDLTLRDKIDYVLDYKYSRAKEEYYPNTRKLLKYMDKTHMEGDEIMNYNDGKIRPITHRAVFSLVMKDPKICSEFLRFVLADDNPGIDFDSITANDIVDEKTFVSVNFKETRVDVFIRGEEHFFNLEMQNERRREYALPKRSKYHHMKMTNTQLGKNVPYCDLKPTIVIFVCMYEQSLPFSSKLLGSFA